MTETRPPRWTEYVPLDDVLKADRNPKNHATNVIRASMQRFGIVELPALDERTGKLVAGHGRLEDWQRARAEGLEPPEGVLVLEDGVWTVPVSRGWSSSDEAEAQAYLITSNNTVIMGGWNEDELDKMLADIAAEDFALAQVTGVGAAELEALLEAHEHETFTAPADELPPLPSPAELLARAQEAIAGSQPYANPAAKAPWMATTAPVYAPPDGSALAAAHRANDMIEHEDVPATDARYAETAEEEAARTARIAAYKKVASGGLVEMILVYTQEDRTEVARLVNDARGVLGSDLKGSEIMLRGLRVLMAVLDERHSSDTVSMASLARAAGWVDEQPA